jgi:hypothetical protein
MLETYTMAATLCLSSRNFLNHLPSEQVAGWNRFLDGRPGVETVLETRTLPAVEAYLGTWAAADRGSLLETELLREGLAWDLVKILGRVALSTGPGKVAAAGGVAALLGGAVGGVMGYNKLDSVMDSGIDWVTDKAEDVIDSSNLPVPDALKNITKTLGGSLKDLGMPAALVMGAAQLFGYDLKTVGGIVGCIILFYTLYQLFKSKGAETGNKVAQGLIDSPKGKTLASKMAQAVQGGNQPLAQAETVLGLDAAPKTGVAERRDAYRRADRHLRETYNMGLLELRRHLTESHGPVEGDKRFRTVSRIALSRVLAG